MPAEKQTEAAVPIDIKDQKILIWRIWRIFLLLTHFRPMFHLRRNQVVDFY